MAENETAAAEPAQQTADEYYATRTAALKGETQPAPKLEVIPEPETVDLAQKQDAKADVPEKDEKAEADEPADKDGEDEPKEERKPRRTLREENYRLREQKRQWNAERDALINQLAGKPGAPGQPKSDAPPTEAKRPRQEDFENYDAYLDARDEFNAKRIRADVTKEFEQKESARRQSAEQAEAVSKFQESSNKAKAKYADFDEAVWELGYKITPDIAQLIAATDDPGELAYHLSQNPDEAARIARLPLAKAALELGKIEARMGSAEPPKPKAVERPKIPETKAPPPTKTVPQGSARPSRTLEELPQNEFYAKRKAQLSGR